MILPKAIEYLESLGRKDYGFTTPECHDALKLGIEALDRIQHLRQLAQEENIRLLPGETKE